MPARPEPAESLHVEYQPSIPESKTARAHDGVQYYGEAAVDIIAVQGLGSWYEWAWSVPTSPHGPRYFWLKESIKHAVPHARVLAYDYNTDWFGDPNRITLEECGARLLRTVILNRTHAGRSKMCPCRSRRPTIFIGHSFGGLVIKQSLVLAAKTEPTDPLYEDHRAYLSSVTSIMFLGTPHFGSSFLELAKWKVLAGKLFGVRTDENLLKILSLNSELLRQLQADFEQVQKKPEMLDLSIYCYYETKDVKEGPISAGLVVTQDSACLHGTIWKGLEKDHIGLNKFKPLDKEYEEGLKPDLIRCFQAADQVAYARFAGQEYGSDSANPNLLNLHHQLVPVASKLNDRLEASLKEIRPRPNNGTTCDWIQGIPTFQAWRAYRDCSVLWIHGKSGSGKSTLAAYVTRLLQPLASDISPYEIPCRMSPTASSCAVVDPGMPALYFLCGIEPASETPRGVLGNLIHQLLMHYSNNWRLHAIVVNARKRLQAGGNVQPIAQLLGELIDIVGGAYIVIDGLEENPQYEEFLDALSPVARANSRMMFLSQNIYGIAQRLQISFKEASISHFDITEHTMSDIDAVVEVRTAELLQSTPTLSEKQEQIVQILKDDADGSFQHVVASIMFLQQGTVSPGEVERSLGGLTNGMAAKYDGILHYVAQRAQYQDRSKIRSALMWACVAAVPLRASHLLNLVQLGEDTAGMALEDVEADGLTDKIAADRLKALLGSTIEFMETDDSELVVQPCHASFRDYITNISGTNSTGTASMRHDFKFSRHDAQRSCAITTMSICTVSCLRLSQGDRFTKEFHLEDYAWRFWSYHLKLSQTELSNTDIRASFNRMLKWVSGDMLSVLEGLGHFSMGRFQIDDIPRKERLNFARSFQEAQKALVSPMKRLVDLRQNLPVAQKLDEHRKLVVAEERRRHEAVQLDTQGTGFIRIGRSHRKLYGLDATSSELERVQVSQLLTAQQDIVEPSKLMVDLAKTAQGLRMVAARFAVDPVHTALLERSKIGQPTIIIMLVAVAHLFDCVSSFPYWSKQPMFIDPLQAFELPSDDIYAAHASVVLLRVLSTESTGIADMVGMVDELPNKSTSPRLELTPGTWLSGMIVHSFMSGQKNILGTFIVNPVVNYQMRRTMHLDFGNPYFFRAPSNNLLRRVPEEMRANPIGTFFRAIPDMMPALFARYIYRFTRAIDPWLWPLLQLQWARIRMVRSHFQLFWYFLTHTRNPGSILSIVSWIFGFGMYMFRRRHFLWFGAHMSPDPWTDTKNAFQDPDKFFQSSKYSWSQIVVYTISYMTGHAFFAGAQAALARADNITAIFARTYISFWLLCTLERGFCQGVTATLYPFAFIATLIKIPRFVSGTACFTILYWLSSFLGMIHSLGRLGLAQYLGGWSIPMGFLSYFLLSWWIISYSELLVDHVFKVLTPVEDAFMFVAHGLLKISIPVLETIAILAIGIGILWGLSVFSRIWEDPLNLGEPVQKLQQVSKAARAKLPEYQPYRLEGKKDSSTVSPAAALAGNVGQGISRAARKYVPRPKME